MSEQGPLTYGDIVRAALTGARSNGATSEEIVRRVISVGYDQMASMRKWPELNGFVNESLALEASFAYLVLPGDASGVYSISDKDTTWTLEKKTLGQQVEDNLAGMDTNSYSIWYSDMGYQPTRRPISTADKIQVFSSDATDTTQDVRIDGVISAPAVQRRENLNLNGATPVNSANTYRAGWSIESIAILTPPAGIVTVQELTDVTPLVLAYLTNENRQPRYHVLKLDAPATAADDITVAYKRRAAPLVEDDDVPVIPVASALVELGIAALKRDQQNYLQAREHEKISSRIENAAFVEHRHANTGVVQSRPDRRMVARIGRDAY